MPQRGAPHQFRHAMIREGVLILLFSAVFAAAGYKIGLGHPKIEYVDVLGPERIVEEPYEVRVEVPVPGPEVYVPVPGPTVVTKIFVPKPRHCPAPPSVADALNEYEARFMIPARSSR